MPTGTEPLVGAIVGALPKSGTHKPDFEEEPNEYDYEPESPLPGEGAAPADLRFLPEPIEEPGITEEPLPATGATSREFLRQQLRQVRTGLDLEMVLLPQSHDGDEFPESPSMNLIPLGRFHRGVHRLDAWTCVSSCEVEWLP